MIVDEYVYIAKNKTSSAHYEARGYTLLSVDWSRLQHFKVRSCDILDGSTVKVRAKCESCGLVRVITFRQYRDICTQCSNKVPASDVTKAKLSTLRKGKLTGADNPSWKGGKPVCSECGEVLATWRGQLCKKCFLSRDQFGEKNPAWKDYSDEERAAAYADRKGYLARRWAVAIKSSGVCDVCGNVNDLHAHHLANWMDNPENRFNESNGVCLCLECHTEFHSKYGKSNNTEQQYLEFKEGCNG